MTAHDGKYTMQWCAIDDIDLDYTHHVVAVLAFQDKHVWSSYQLTMDDVLVNCPLSTAFTLYRMWRAGDLRRLTSAHNMQAPSRESAPDMIERLDAHVCQRDCPAVIIVFQTLCRLRDSVKVDGARERVRKIGRAHV